MIQIDKNSVLFEPLRFERHSIGYAFHIFCTIDVYDRESELLRKSHKINFYGHSLNPNPFYYDIDCRKWITAIENFKREQYIKEYGCKENEIVVCSVTGVFPCDYTTENN